ncbi:hypothetical protein GGR56DRAFT_609063 [Xylariaceae sp. FL0804]|nr:hypothetical protein GGR56DRAFT_609063 [Xylariaceae sp. FL0804]
MWSYRYSSLLAPSHILLLPACLLTVQSALPSWDVDRPSHPYPRLVSPLLFFSSSLGSLSHGHQELSLCQSPSTRLRAVRVLIRAGEERFRVQSESACPTPRTLISRRQARAPALALALALAHCSPPSLPSIIAPTKAGDVWSAHSSAYAPVPALLWASLAGLLCPVTSSLSSTVETTAEALGLVL